MEKQRGIIEVFLLWPLLGVALLAASMAAGANDDHVIPEPSPGSHWGNGGYDCDASASGPAQPPHCMDSSDHGRRPEGQQEWN